MSATEKTWECKVGMGEGAAWVQSPKTGVRLAIPLDIPQHAPVPSTVYAVLHAIRVTIEATREVSPEREEFVLLLTLRELVAWKGAADALEAGAARDSAARLGVVTPEAAALEAMKLLAKKCDGARSLDSKGFSKWDADAGHRLARLRELRPWSWEARKALQLAKKYRAQLKAARPELLSAMGIEA